MSLRYWLILLTLSVLFGSSFLFIKLAIIEVTPLTLATVRTVLAAAIAYVAMRATKQEFPTSKAVWKQMFLLSLITSVIPYVAIAWGQQHIDASLGAILFSTIPIYTVLFAPLILPEEQFTIASLIGVAVGFLGVVFVIGPEALYKAADYKLGVIVNLLGAVSYAMSNIYVRQLKDLSPLVMTAGQLCIAALLLVPLSFIFEQPWVLSPSIPTIFSLIALASFSTALPVLILFWFVKNTGVTNTSMLAFFVPISAVLLGVFILGETIPLLGLVGFGFIILGAMIVTGTLNRAIATIRASI